MSITLIGLIVYGLLCIFNPLCCCSIPVLLPMLWAGYVYHENEEKKKRMPRLPPETMV